MLQSSRIGDRSKLGVVSGRMPLVHVNYEAVLGWSTEIVYFPRLSLPLMLRMGLLHDVCHGLKREKVFDPNTQCLCNSIEKIEARDPFGRFQVLNIFTLS